MLSNKETTDLTIHNIDSLFNSLPVDMETEAKPNILRQMIWDAVPDHQVEEVVKMLGLTPASPEVYDAERDDSQDRIKKLTPIGGMVGLAIENMARIHEGMMRIHLGDNVDHLPEEVKAGIVESARRYSHLSIISTLSMLLSTGMIKINA